MNDASLQQRIERLAYERSIVRIRVKDIERVSNAAMSALKQGASDVEVSAVILAAVKHYASLGAL